MIDCPNGDMRDLLPDLLHDRLPAAQRMEVERHVASCDDCGAELALLRDLRGTMARVPTIDSTAIAAAIPSYRAPARRSWVGWRAAAAITMIAAGGTSVALLNHQGSSSAGNEVVVAPAPRVPVSRSPESVSAPRSARASEKAPVSDAESVHAAKTPPRSAAMDVEPPIAMASGAVNELSDRELSKLIDEIETLDVLPSADVESSSSMLPPISSDGRP